MLPPVFEEAYLLKSLGWGIANSFWQIGSLWLLYQFITSIDKKLPALVKHHLSILLLLTSFTWFVFTIVQNYRLLSNTATTAATSLNAGWMPGLQLFNNALPVISIVYLACFCFYTLQFCKNLSGNRFLQTEGLTRAPVDFRLFADQTALHLGIKKKIHVWLSEYVDVPSVTGFIKPVILLPAAIITQLSPRQIEAIILHELAHIKRNDYLVNLLQSVVELTLFFNPFAVLLSKVAKRERENCCDDWVMTFRYDHYDYAKALLVLEEQRHFLQSAFALTATNGKKNLLQRVKRLFNTGPQTSFSSLQKFKLVGICLILSTVIFTVFPYMTNIPVNNKVDTYGNKEKTKPVKVDKLSKEIVSNNILRNLPVRPAPDKKPPVVNNKIKKQPAKEPTTDYVNAFVNEELFTRPLQVEPIVSQVINKERANSKYLVKIEEQQSGRKQTTTYYFEFNNKDGNAAIKPLIMLNKSKVLKKTVERILPDSLDTSTKPCKKKINGITS